MDWTTKQQRGGKSVWNTKLSLISGAETRSHRSYQWVGEEDTEEVSIDLFLKVPETQTQAGQVFQEEEVLRGDNVISDGG